MPAEVETMFYTREKSWHGLSVKIKDDHHQKKYLWQQDEVLSKYVCIFFQIFLFFFIYIYSF